MITGLIRDSVDTSLSRACLRLIGCSMNRMLASQALQPRRALHAPPQIEQGGEIVVLLVAVERGMIGAGDRVQHRRDLGEALQIGVDVAADLELEEGVAVGRDDFFERLRQAVVRPAPDGRRWRRPGRPYGARRCSPPASTARGIPACRSRPDPTVAPAAGRDRCPADCSASPRRTSSPRCRHSASRTARSICAGPKLATSGLRPCGRAGGDLLRRNARRNGRTRCAAWPPGRYRRRQRARARGAAGRNCPRSRARDSCRTTWAPASPPPRPSASCRRDSSMRARTNACGASVSVTTPNRNGMRRRTSRS